MVCHDAAEHGKWHGTKSQHGWHEPSNDDGNAEPDAESEWWPGPAKSGSAERNEPRHDSTTADAADASHAAAAAATAATAARCGCYAAHEQPYGWW